MTIEQSPIRLVAVDLDRTLLDDNRKLSDRNRRALQRCIENGVQIAVCSGRDLPATRAITKDWQFPCWLVVQNGSLVLDPDVTAIDIRTFTQEQAVRVLDVLERHDLPPVVYDVHPNSHRVWWQRGAQAAPGVLEFRREHGSTIDFVDDMRTVLTQDISHMEVLEDASKIFAAERELASDSDVVTLANMSSSTKGRAMLGIYVAGTSKEQALARVAEINGIDATGVLAIGDNLNDIGMVQWAGIGVMVANGPDAARAVADWIAPSNNDSGVAVAIEKFVFTE